MPRRLPEVDVQAYLRRIGFETADSDVIEASQPYPDFEILRRLHRAHLFSVPFENLDIGLGRKIVCDEAHFLHKIINEHRGGFCYELNGAFAALLRTLGFRVTLLSARVARSGGGNSPEFDHLALLVDLEEPWLADVGFGENFLDPLRLECRYEQRQNGRAYRITSPDGKYALEVKIAGKWKMEYSFSLRPRRLSEFAAMCHYHQTSPESHFTQQSICSLATPDGRITLSDHKLIETSGTSRRETTLSGEGEWRAQLRQRFGIVLRRMAKRNPEGGKTRPAPTPR